MIIVCGIVIKVIKVNYICFCLIVIYIIDGEINFVIGIGLYGLGYVVCVFD